MRLRFVVLEYEQRLASSKQRKVKIIGVRNRDVFPVSSRGG
nr:MAG TPA: hypothetical protein [Caudoviricetes sp.]